VGGGPGHSWTSQACLKRSLANLELSIFSSDGEAASAPWRRIGGAPAHTQSAGLVPTPISLGAPGRCSTSSRRRPIDRVGETRCVFLASLHRAPPNRGASTAPKFHGARAPVEEPSTASEPDSTPQQMHRYFDRPRASLPR
jgi:hypothetical protein